MIHYWKIEVSLLTVKLLVDRDFWWTYCNSETVAIVSQNVIELCYYYLASNVLKLCFMTFIDMYITDNFSTYKILRKRPRYIHTNVIITFFQYLRFLARDCKKISQRGERGYPSSQIWFHFYLQNCSFEISLSSTCVHFYQFSIGLDLHNVLPIPHSKLPSHKNL